MKKALNKPGSERRVFQAGPLTFGVVICHEGWRYPETARWAARRGAQVVFHPHFSEAAPGSYRPTTSPIPPTHFMRRRSYVALPRTPAISQVSIARVPALQPLRRSSVQMERSWLTSHTARKDCCSQTSTSRPQLACLRHVARLHRNRH